jgi:hypothetical protein
MFHAAAPLPGEPRPGSPKLEKRIPVLLDQRRVQNGHVPTAGFDLL